VGQNGGATNIRKGPSSDYDVAHIGYPGDEVDVLDSSVDRSGTTWYHVRFLKSQATGWISGQFLSLEDSSYTPGQSSAPSQPEEIVRTDLETNATIGGESGPINIRSGPGPAYAELHIAYPGDRVLVIDSNTGTDGQPWYKVYFSKSKAEGWIAGFLLNLD
jgi:serine/threonine-protein kinase